VIRLSSEAEQQVAELLRHYARLGRPEAGRNLIAAIDQAVAQIEQEPEQGLPAPRPYPALVRPGRAWTKVGRYWIAYSTAMPPPVILGVFYDAAGIPGRI
jgi:plasmid stabilization system protein ParE